LQKICTKCDDSKPIISFNSKLWDDLRKGTLIINDRSRITNENEVKVLLDLNRILGCIEICRLQNNQDLKKRLELCEFQNWWNGLESLTICMRLFISYAKCHCT